MQRPEGRPTTQPGADKRSAEIRAAFEAFNRGDVEAVLAFLDPQLVSCVSGELMNAGTWKGHEGFFEMVVAWNEAFADTRYDFQSAEHVDESYSIAHVRQHSVGRQSGVPVEMEPAYLIEMVNGRARRFEIHPDRDAAMQSYETLAASSG